MSRIDRIAEPWGTRTPYGPGEPWPVRVDSYLDGDLTEDDVDRWVQSASILHSNGDALDIAVKDGRIARVRGRTDLRHLSSGYAADIEPPYTIALVLVQPHRDFWRDQLLTSW